MGRCGKFFAEMGFHGNPGTSLDPPLLPECLRGITCINQPEVIDEDLFIISDLLCS